MIKIKLMIIWLVLIVILIFDLIFKVNSANSDFLKWEAHLFYFSALFYLSFPLGSIMIILYSILIDFIDINLSLEIKNIIDVIMIAIVSTISFYIQWYILFPKLISYLKIMVNKKIV
ncbi:hypothetical protein [Volucribacter amazonae]|uniref:Uncharacterized protein n=1 Tax=Volucribacter amazonae TaxID=256731 RepID=A0A9X4PDL6_9PAST|nr:hypothetical protein [Volucribacter amazonae]MDG6896222.1 hypothetical protein [Volucribacter amazonae]